MAIADFVDWTRTDALQRLTDFERVSEWRPERYRRQVIELSAKRFEIDSEGWRIGGDRLCGRYARIRGVAMDIATFMVYPTSRPDVFPVFAAEWVVFGDRVHALILDVEVCGNQPNLVEDLRHEFALPSAAWRARFPENRERPEWFESIAMPWVLYGSCAVDRLPELRDAYNDYLQRTIDAFYRPRLDMAEPGRDHAEVERYKAHHYENSPGHRLLGVKMGKVEADELLRDWHFGPTRTACGAPAFRPRLLRPAGSAVR